MSREIPEHPVLFFSYHVVRLFLAMSYVFFIGGVIAWVIVGRQSTAQYDEIHDWAIYSRGNFYWVNGFRHFLALASILVGTLGIAVNHYAVTICTRRLRALGLESYIINDIDN